LIFDKFNANFEKLVFIFLIWYVIIKMLVGGKQILNAVQNFGLLSQTARKFKSFLNLRELPTSLATILTTKNGNYQLFGSYQSLWRILWKTTKQRTKQLKLCQRKNTKQN
jgi:hypothetical protein